MCRRQAWSKKRIYNYQIFINICHVYLMHYPTMPYAIEWWWHFDMRTCFSPHRKKGSFSSSPFHNMHSVERGFPFILAPMHVIRDRKYQSSFINEEFGTCYWFACLQWFFVKFVMNTSAVLSSTRQYWRTPMVKQSDILTHILATKNEHPSVRSCCEPCLHRVQCFKTAGRKVTGTGAFEKKGKTAG